MQTATPNEKKLIAKELFNAEEKLQSFSTYFQFYDFVTRPQYGAIVEIDPPALKTHAEIRNLALKLMADPENTRKEFQEKAFPQTSKDAGAVQDQQRAIDVVVQLMLMIDCSDKDRHHQGYEIGGFRPVSWNSSEKFTDFVEKAFPMDLHDQEKVRTALNERNELKCWNLKKHAHVKFVSTNNLAEHLLHDPVDNVVRLFGQTTFLKARLKLSAGQPTELGIADSLKLGTLPPQLLLETLHSLQYIIFSLVDKKSSRFLKKLIRDKKSSFDPDCSIIDTNNMPPPENFEYHYWGDRIVKLNHLVTQPMPRYRIDLWIQRNASDRNTMFVAILSLVLSALFGFLSVVLGILQLWVGYVAWKEQPLATLVATPAP